MIFKKVAEIERIQISSLMEQTLTFFTGFLIWELSFSTGGHFNKKSCASWLSNETETFHEKNLHTSTSLIVDVKSEIS
jgi:hypothetical protein